LHPVIKIELSSWIAEAGRGRALAEEK